MNVKRRNAYIIFVVLVGLGIALIMSLKVSTPSDASTSNLTTPAARCNAFYDGAGSGTGNGSSGCETLPGGAYYDGTDKWLSGPGAVFAQPN